MTRACARDMLVDLDHPAAGRITVLGNPLRFSETPTSVRRPPPRLGEHTEEVVGEAAALAEERDTPGQLGRSSRMTNRPRAWGWK